MEGLDQLENMDNKIDEVKTTRCDQRFKIFSGYKDSFGAEFDNLKFMNYTTGQMDVPGASLRDAQTGCEIYEKLGWNSGDHNSTGFHTCGCKQFDEQLRFVSEEGKPISNIEYRRKGNRGSAPHIPFIKALI